MLVIKHCHLFSSELSCLFISLQLYLQNIFIHKSNDVCPGVRYVPTFFFFQYNVTLDDVYSPQSYGGPFVPMDPKPGGT